MYPDKRKCQRNAIFLIIHFRLIHNSCEYALGIARNYSDDGLSMESHNFDYKPGQLLECRIEHPGIDRSLSILGEIVWKKDGWYDAAMGVKFLHMQKDTLKAIQELVFDRQKKSGPVLSEESTFNTGPEKHTLNMIPQSGSPDKTENRTAPAEKKIKTPDRGMPLSKSRTSHFRFSVVLVLSTLLIFSIVARDRIDDSPLSALSGQKADSLLPDQNNVVVAVASDEAAASSENDRNVLPGGNIPVNPGSYEAAFPIDIIRDEITFDVNSADISSKFSSVINEVADILLGNPGLIVKLEGHTDSAGSEIYNMDLSIRRAAAVRSELINRGILSSRIKIVCFGHSSPAASNDIESGRMKNRRVEISIPLSHS